MHTYRLLKLLLGILQRDLLDFLFHIESCLFCNYLITFYYGF